MKTYKIAVIGQGYVGLPLSLEFAAHYPVLGFDINAQRVDQLNDGQDITLEADI
jgi:UDP-N-acetyl-D-galactosamine dehydrogenase